MREKRKEQSGTEGGRVMGRQVGAGIQIRAVLSVLLPLAGFLLLLLYIRSACCDVVYSDYIRLVNSYLPDTLNPAKLLVSDVLTRIPLTYLIRFLNCQIFGYSVTFDRVLGTLGLLLSGLVLGRYMLRERLSVGIMLSVYLVLFSLNKWEMLLNGSGYPHFLAFALFYDHFLVLERIYTGTVKRRDYVLSILLPLLALLAAGPYLAVYIVCLVLLYGYMWISKNRNVDKCSRRYYGYWTLAALLALFLYLLSNHFAVYEYAGAQDVGLLQVLTGQPAFVLHFLLNGFASMLLGGELLEKLLGNGVLSYPMIYGLGLLVLLAYGFAAFVYLHRGFYRRTVLPALLLLYGLGSHGIVFLSRYIFLNETYAWQSRYSLQYQSGILGILLIFGLLWKEGREANGGGVGKPVKRQEMRKQVGPEEKRHSTEQPRRSLMCPEEGRASEKRVGAQVRPAALLGLFLSLAFLCGNLWTCAEEIKKAPAREAHYEAMAAATQQLDQYSDEELEALFEYHHGGDRIRAAFGILESQHWNVYRQ